MEREQGEKEGGRDGEMERGRGRKRVFKVHHPAPHPVSWGTAIFRLALEYSVL